MAENNLSVTNNRDMDKNSNFNVQPGRRLNLSKENSKSIFSRPKGTDGQLNKASGLSAFVKTNSKFISTKPVRREEVYVFANQLAVLLDAGLSMLAALSILYQQTEDARFRKVIAHIQEDINAGATVTKAFSSLPDVFPQLFVSMIRAAQVGGQLPQILRLVSHYLQEQDEVDKKLKSAIVYPKFVFIFFMLVLMGILFGLVPKFEETFKSFGSELPAPTQLLLDFSRFAFDNLVFGIVGIVASFISYKRFKKTDAGRLFFAKVKLRIPVVGDLTQKSSLSKFCRTLKILMQSGVPLVESLEIAGETAENILFTNALKNIKQGVIGGQSLSKKMNEFAIFPAMVVKMIATGEESGSLGKMLKSISELYDTHVDTKIAGLTTIIEPALMIGIGIIVVIVILALYLPIFNMGSLDFN